jgi:hypothetical protein
MHPAHSFWIKYQLSIFKLLISQMQLERGGQRPPNITVSRARRAEQIDVLTPQIFRTFCARSGDPRHLKSGIGPWMGLATGGFSLAQASIAHTDDRINAGHIICVICAPVPQAVLHEAGIHSLEHRSTGFSAWTIEARLERATDAVTDRK